jgi:hypothetical protein
LGDLPLSLFFLLRLLLFFTDPKTRPKQVVKARLFGKRAPRAPEVLPMAALQLPKAMEPSSSEEEIQFEFSNPGCIAFS